jgi:hypothetical protein
MTEPRKRTTGEVWEALEKISDEADLARVDAQSGEEVDRALREAGIDPEEAAKTGMNLLTPGLAEKPATAPASLRPPDSRGMRKSGRHAPKVSGVTWLAAAAVLALVIAALIGRRDTVAQAPTAPTAPTPSEAPREPTLEERAEPIRGDAYAACEQARWDRCEAKLNEARALDPAGETQPRVLFVRQLLDRVRLADGGKNGKP